MIATRLTAVISFATKPVRASILRLIEHLHTRCRGPKQPAHVDAGERVVPESKLIFYFKNMVPSLLLNVALQVGEGDR